MGVENVDAALAGKAAAPSNSPIANFGRPSPVTCCTAAACRFSVISSNINANCSHLVQ
jgi:hypothetical protein